MDKKRIIHIIQAMPHKDVVDFLLDRCNLNTSEVALIYARAKEGVTQEQYAEQMGYSPRHYQRIEDNAFAKVIKNWATLDFLEIL